MSLDWDSSCPSLDDLCSLALAGASSLRFSSWGLGSPLSCCRPSFTYLIAARPLFGEASEGCLLSSSSAASEIGLAINDSRTDATLMRLCGEPCEACDCSKCTMDNSALLAALDWTDSIMLREDYETLGGCFCPTACDMRRNLLRIGSGALSVCRGSDTFTSGLPPRLIELERLEECQVPEETLPWLPDALPCMAAALSFPDRLLCSET